ncbi:trehalose 6-phosphate phosphatase [Psychromicrobium silvestre]|uniref:Trehalose 6-phosphate phosphatase n=1 Tax=Psychromicrobium silvestre TaxID=1645614 RepID=A0A7Y9S7V7_9MICC|nr:trehalose-phosphatase [Psychromicrobium silvestre]NYE96304.1 trehalose 6-phosphate phosphatase [Psychromicrobium silvestre]
MISAELAHALNTLCRTERLLIALDFDGTLSPLVPRAEDARPLPASAAAFAELAELPDTITALISGRALDSLRSVASPPASTLLIGSHGAETWFGPGQAPLQLEPAQQELLGQGVELIQKVASEHQGTTVELKPAGVVLHTRQASPDVAEQAVSAAKAALSELGAHLQEGKRVLELSVLQVDKGQGLDLLRSISRPTAVLFAGDDTTDEDGFRALSGADVGIKVGDGPTAAAYRIGSVRDTPELLKTILRLRRTANNSAPVM